MKPRDGIGIKNRLIYFLPLFLLHIPPQRLLQRLNMPVDKRLWGEN